MIISLSNGKLCISNTAEDLSHIPTAKKNFRLGRWEVSPYFAGAVLAAYPNARVTQEVRDVTHKFTRPTAVPLSEIPPYEFLGEQPAAHQIRGFQLLQQHDKFGLFWEMGTRKTATTLYDLDARLDSGRALKGLIISPLSVLHGWVDQAKRFIKRPVMPIIGTPAQKRNAIDAPYNIFAINYDGLQSYGDKIIKTIQPDYVVLDESHNIKTPRAIRTRKCLELGEIATTKRILTGSPISKNQLDLYCQMRFLDKGIFPWPSWFAFKNRFGIEVPMGGFRKVVGVRDEDEIAAMVAPFVDELLFDDCFDMPPWTDIRVVVGMNGAQREAYDAIRKELLTRIAGNKVTVQNAAGILVKLRQISGGTLIDDFGIAHILGSPKLDAVKEAMDEVRVPVVIWTAFRAETEWIANELQIPYIHGGVSQTERTEILKGFENGLYNGLVAQIDSLSEGVNELVATHVEVRWNYSFRYTAWVQSRARLRRSGQQTDMPCRSIQLVTEGSVDEKVMDAIGKTADVAANTLAQIRELLT